MIARNIYIQCIYKLYIIYVYVYTVCLLINKYKILYLDNKLFYIKYENSVIPNKMIWAGRCMSNNIVKNCIFILMKNIWNASYTRQSMISDIYDICHLSLFFMEESF